VSLADTNNRGAGVNMILKKSGIIRLEECVLKKISENPLTQFGMCVLLLAD
jgi:hypothetical protein